MPIYYAEKSWKELFLLIWTQLGETFKPVHIIRDQQIQYLLNTYYMQVFLLDTGDTTLNKALKSCSMKGKERKSKKVINTRKYLETFSDSLVIAGLWEGNI